MLLRFRVKFFLIFTTFALLNCPSAFALDCNNLIDIWTGNFNNLKNVYLSINDKFLATIHFTTSNGAYVNLGALSATGCQPNPDGTVNIHLAQNVFGISANIDAELTSLNTLNVSSFTANTPMGWYGDSGSLTNNPFPLFQLSPAFSRP